MFRYTGQFSTAIKDYSSALEYCREVLPDSHRTMADLHTYIGLAYMFHADEASEEESSEDVRNPLQTQCRVTWCSMLLFVPWIKYAA